METETENNCDADVEDNYNVQERSAMLGQSPIIVSSSTDAPEPQVVDVREQRSHIAIIQMAPPAHGSFKDATPGAGAVLSKKMKAGVISKRAKAGGPVRRENTPKVKKRHHCSVQGCSYSTPYTKDLARHMRKHTGEKPYSCDRCSKSFTRYDKLVMHIRIHEGHRPFSCQLCNYAATDSSSLRKHLRTHSDERPYKCQLCAYSSKDSSQLIVHLRHHTGDSPYVCVFEGCDAAFKTPSDLSRHTRLHTGEKPYKCPYCNYRAAVKSNLNVHVRTHTNKPKRGKYNGLRKHVMNSDDNEEEDFSEETVSKNIPSKSNPELLPFQYACKLCDHKSDTIELFTLHLEKEHPDSNPGTRKKAGKGRPPKKLKDFADDERNYQCSSCNAAFKCENSLRCHMRQHGTVPNKPANVDPEIYTPSRMPIAQSSFTRRVEHSSTGPYPNTVSSDENSYTLHEMQRMPLVQSVITENPSVITNSTGMIGNGTSIVQQHYDPETGRHLYVVSYENAAEDRDIDIQHHPQTHF